MGNVFPDPCLAAIVDRVTFNAHILNHALRCAALIRRAIRLPAIAGGGGCQRRRDQLVPARLRPSSLLIMGESDTTAPLLTARFQRAFAVASEVHATQVRKGTHIPYLAHLMSVAALVLEHGGREDAAIAGLLHDAVEDSGDGKQMETRIRKEFGDRVADIVMGCSDAVAIAWQDKPPWRERKEQYLLRLREETDTDVLLVSACDKLHNLRSILTDLRAIGSALWDASARKTPPPSSATTSPWLPATATRSPLRCPMNWTAWSRT